MRERVDAWTRKPIYPSTHLPIGGLVAELLQKLTEKIGVVL